ncbi:ORF6N domain-containing protein [Mariprofundus sp. EBB-1]|uniref:ORF6N domain-containing protein n=1 Tax=Mariprofundus sp. EBB-1 TaxID=2650971 RepID=UPI000EF1ADDE|nr:ORF6N domain-containing protein [Mariprofundus sp. EBB-1]RLL50702.1 ORF6N domain-containing protein [Mariprofundus sp. EBB-1]
MSHEVSIINSNELQSKIFTIRGLQVMMDSDLAELYGVENKRLNEQVKRNIERFPEQFRFQLTQEELENLKSQFATSSAHGGRRTLPYVFTEQGVSMLSAVLRSDTAINVSIQIMDAFVGMRKFISNNAVIFQRLDSIEQKQHITDTKLDKVFEAIEAKDIKPEQGIFYNGEVFDAYVFAADLIKSAKKSIVLIDNYVDETTLTLLTKRNAGCTATIYTHTFGQKLQLDLEKHNEQYPAITIKTFKKSHDRFLIIDDNEVYHFGASLKDLGKKWFAFSKFDKGALEVLGKLGHE